MGADILYRFVGSPALQNCVYSTREAALAATTGDIELVQDPHSGLVHNRAFDARRLSYTPDYQNEQAHSETFQHHLEHVLGIVRSNATDGRSVIEIGCGKAHFFAMMRQAGLDAFGFDPAYEGEDPRIRKVPYTGNPDERNGAGLLVIRHVLEHIDAPWEFLANACRGADDEARIYIEVPCFEWIVKHRAFFDVFYEHVNYFTLDVLTKAFSNVLDSGHLFGEQYLYVVARAASFRQPRGGGPRFENLKLAGGVRDALERRETNRAYIWGAGAKGVTFALLALREGTDIEGLLDINPRKQGRFAAGSGLPIHAPESVRSRLQGADVFVMNPNYLDEISHALEGVDSNLITL